MRIDEWKNSIKKDKRVKRYQHIDRQINLNTEKGLEKVRKTLSDLESHQFLPFIKRETTYYRYIKKDSDKPQKDKKTRPIMYASHLDSAIYSYYNFIYSQNYEKVLKDNGLSENISAYRSILNPSTGKGKSNIDFAHDVYLYLKKRESCAVITQDIKGFFDRINHSILKENLCDVLNKEILDKDDYKVFKSLTRYKYIEHKDFLSLKKKIKKGGNYIFNILKDVLKNNKNGYGIPQGSPISGLLSNIYMLKFDLSIRNKEGVHLYKRYSDDLVFICDKENVNYILKFIDDEISKSKLEVQPKKCSIAYIDKCDGDLICTKVTDKNGKSTNRSYFDYLGFEFYGDKILVRKKTIGRLGWKQRSKVEHHAENSNFSKKDYKRKLKNKSQKTRKISTNYLSRIIDIFNTRDIKKQVLKMKRKRNQLKEEVNKPS